MTTRDRAVNKKPAAGKKGPPAAVSILGSPPGDAFAKRSPRLRPQSTLVHSAAGTVVSRV